MGFPPSIKNFTNIFIDMPKNIKARIAKNKTNKDISQQCALNQIIFSFPFLVYLKVNLGFELNNATNLVLNASHLFNFLLLIFLPELSN